jgi:hypothetical protein
LPVAVNPPFEIAVGRDAECRVVLAEFYMANSID